MTTRLQKIRERFDEFEEALTESRGHGDQFQVGYYVQAHDIRWLLDMSRGLTHIADHGFMSTKFSTPKDLVHVMDWMVNTAKAALAGEELPHLDPEEEPEPVVAPSTDIKPEVREVVDAFVRDWEGRCCCWRPTWVGGHHDDPNCVYREL